MSVLPNLQGRKASPEGELPYLTYNGQVSVWENCFHSSHSMRAQLQQVHGRSRDLRLPQEQQAAPR